MGSRPYLVIGRYGVRVVRDGQFPIWKLLGGEFQSPDGDMEAAVRVAGKSAILEGVGGKIRHFVAPVSQPAHQFCFAFFTN